MGLTAKDNYLFEVPRVVLDDFFSAVENFDVPKIKNHDTENFLAKVQSSKSIYAPIPKEELHTFNTTYFHRNLLKSILAFNYFPNSYTKEGIVDFGCGLGTASIAWIVGRKRLLAGGTNCILIDDSPSQLSQARSVIENSKFDDISAQYYNKVPDKIPKGYFSFFCYSLCELWAQDENLKLFTDETYVVDYRRVLYAASYQNRQRNYDVELRCTTVKLPKALADMVDQREIRVNFLHAFRL